MQFLLKKVLKMERDIVFIKQKLILKDDKSTDDEPAIMIKGVHIQRMKSDDYYAYGLRLLDSMFKKEVQAVSLMMPAPTSEKQPLDEKKVSKILEMIEAKFKDQKKYRKNFDMKVFKSKVNQKCRDARKYLKRASTESEKPQSDSSESESE